ncbi:MAG TPA: acetyl-coenzyme A synthetase, partial [Gammaproteobacteria bacterium]|nr:acetyl-coenzyme A synthetase [Gammaproteobacteria bacterium]
MSELKVYPVPPVVAASAHIDDATYRKMYRESIDDPDTFWAARANEFITWFGYWDKVSQWDFVGGKIRWFDGATLNASYNCLDRHLAKRSEQTAIISEGDDPKDDKKISYRELHAEVCCFANALKDRGVKKGDRVSIYMPMVVEATVAMLACARIGAVHSIVF